MLSLAAAALFCACNHLDDQRTPPAKVYIPFVSEHDWNTYGTPGASDYRIFIKDERKPANFPYTALSATGFGGVLLVGDIHGSPVAYDLSCPVENRNDVRLTVDAEQMQAYCPKCNSRYEIITNYGIPLSGPAKDNEYGLTKYYVGPGLNGEYMIISR